MTVTVIRRAGAHADCFFAPVYKILMFGYIRALEDTLSPEDLALYRGSYCGLCSVLGDKYGKRGKLALSHDLVFLAVLYNGLYEEETGIREGMCLFRKGIHTEWRTSACFQYAADMDVLLAYGNYLDRVYDGQKNRNAAKAAALLLKKDYEAIGLQYPHQKEAVEQYLLKLHETEKRGENNPDAAAKLTGEMLAKVLLWKEDPFAVYLRPLFYHLGRFIYLSDAYEDVEKDVAEGQYNPYAPYRLRDDFDALVELHLKDAAGEAARSFEMLPLIRNAGLLRNILYSGIWIGYTRARKKRAEEEK